MNSRKLFLVIACLGGSKSLWAAPVRYLDTVFTEVTVASNIVYGSNLNADGSKQTLKLDMYQPTGDTAKARPLVIFLFGGGWVVGSKTDWYLPLVCQNFAKRGYVAASIQYRLDPGLLTRKTAELAQIANFRGMQDAKGAVRFLRAHKADYKIDDTRIFLGGFSAGAFIALAAAFLDAKEIPSYIDTNKVGGIEGNSGTPGVSSAVNGVFNNWGAIADSAWLLNNNIPVVSFAGTADPEVPFDHNDSLCGSACIDRVLKRNGKHSELKPFVGMGHGIVMGNKRYDTLLTMASQFSYDVLFKSGPTTINPGFNRASLSKNAMLSQFDMIYSLDGRAVPTLPATRFPRQVFLIVKPQDGRENEEWIVFTNGNGGERPGRRLGRIPDRGFRREGWIFRGNMRESFPNAVGPGVPAAE